MAPGSNIHEVLVSMINETERYVLIKATLDGSICERQILESLQDGLELMKQLRCRDLDFEYYLLDTMLKKKILATPDPAGDNEAGWPSEARLAES